MSKGECLAVIQYVMYWYTFRRLTCHVSIIWCCKPSSIYICMNRLRTVLFSICKIMSSPMCDNRRRRALVSVGWPVVWIALAPVLKYRLAHLGNYLFLLSKIIFSGWKYPKNKLINFEKRSTGWHILRFFIRIPFETPTPHRRASILSNTMLCPFLSDTSSASFLAETSVRSPRKLFIFII